MGPKVDFPSDMRPSSSWKLGASDINIQDLLAAVNVMDFGALSVIEEIDRDLPEG